MKKHVITLLCALSLAGTRSELVAQDGGIMGQKGLFIRIDGLVVPAIDAQNSREFGFYSGTDTTLTYEFGTGWGFGIFVGLGFSDWLTAYGGFHMSFHDVTSERYNNGNTDFFELGIRLQVPSEGISPYASLAIGSHGISMNRVSEGESVTYVYPGTGEDTFGAAFGAGIRSGLFDIGYLYSSTSFDEVFTSPVAEHRITIGVVLWFDIVGK